MQDLGINVLFYGRTFERLMEGLGITLYIAGVSIVLSVVFGIVVGIAMTARNPVLQVITRFYLEVMRVMPVVVLLFLFYYTLSSTTNISLSPMFVGILVFTLWGAAEMGDLVRSALTSLPRHQRQSGQAIGLTEGQIYFYILVPQAARRTIPPLINLATRMIKTTPFVFFIGVVDLIKVGQQVIENVARTSPTASLWIYGFIFVLYFLMCYPLSLLAQHLERRLEQA